MDESTMALWWHQHNCCSYIYQACSSKVSQFPVPWDSFSLIMSAKHHVLVILNTLLALKMHTRNGEGFCFPIRLKKPGCISWQRQTLFMGGFVLLTCYTVLLLYLRFRVWLEPKVTVTQTPTFQFTISTSCYLQSSLAGTISCCLTAERAS